jgi:hypothetical protein
MALPGGGCYDRDRERLESGNGRQPLALVQPLLID